MLQNLRLLGGLCQSQALNKELLCLEQKVVSAAVTAQTIVSAVARNVIAKWLQEGI